MPADSKFTLNLVESSRCWAIDFTMISRKNHENCREPNRCQMTRLKKVHHFFKREMVMLAHLKDIPYGQRFVALQVRGHSLGQLFVNGSEATCFSLKDKLIKQKRNTNMSHVLIHSHMTSFSKHRKKKKKLNRKAFIILTFLLFVHKKNQMGYFIVLWMEGNVYHCMYLYTHKFVTYVPLCKSANSGPCSPHDI